MDSDLGLVPAPRHLERGGEGAHLGCPVNEQPSGGLPPQGFELEVGSASVTIRSGDEAGLRYARRALDQLRQSADERYPGVMIRDWPDFPVRGYMLDVSRNRVPTRETLARIVDVMALARLNQLQLYTEHTYAYRDHQMVWADASPLTPEDVTWLDAVCRDQGIELVPNQNCFGHMGRWLQHDGYRGRAESPDGYELGGVEFDPQTLQPTPENAEFALRLVDELIANYSTNRINVGCDEALELGQGRSAADVAARGAQRVYFDHLLRIVEPLVRRGHEVQFWYDLEPEHAGLLRELPARTVPIAWGYEALPTPNGPAPDLNAGRWSPHRALTRNIPALAEHGQPFWVAPGTSSWNSFVGRVDNALVNLAEFAAVGQEHGAEGFLITDWGDNGHLQPPSVSFGPMVYGGAVSWCRASNAGLDVPAALDRYVFADEAGLLGRAFEGAGRAWAMTGQQAINTSPMFAALLPGPFVPVFGEPDRSAVEDVLGTLDDLDQQIAGSDPRSTDGHVVKHELRAAIRLARHGAWKLMEKAGGISPTTDFLRRDLEDAIRDQEEAWLLRSRSGGLESSLAPLHRAVAQLA